MLDTPDQAPVARPFQFTGRIRSFYHAIRGILRMIRCQHNAWIHAAATLVVLAGFCFAFPRQTGAGSFSLFLSSGPPRHPIPPLSS